MKLYKKDTKGKIRFALFELSGETYTVTTGIMNSDKYVSHPKTCLGKNIGRSNETSAEEQASIEMKAKYVKKLKEGYFKTIEEAETEVVIRPMLAKSYKDVEVQYPCYAQPKYDGMRMIKNCDNMKSRAGNDITTLPHIEGLFSSLKDYVDGEVYSHAHSFQENMKLIKKYREGETEQIKYNVYDIMLPNMPFIDRYMLLKSLVSAEGSEYLVLAPIKVINNEEELIEYHKENLAQGYEGTMIRHTSEGYKLNGRSSQLLKYKDFIDETYEIVDIEPTEVRPEHGTPILKMGDGRLFRAGVKGTHEYRKELLRNKESYIGKTAEIRFFEYSDEGVPRFPVFCGIRLDK